MKKLIAFILIFSISAISVPSLTHAETVTYAMVISDSAYLYADASGVVTKYILPKSYFVFVTETFGDFARITVMQGLSDCPQVEGYVKLVDLKFFDGKPENPYLDLTLTAISDEVLFGDSAAQKPKTVITKGSTVKFYGEYILNNQKYYYVYSNGYIGYVRSTGFDEPLIPLHPEYIKLIEDSSATSSFDDSKESSYNEGTSQKNKFEVSNIIVIALILICGLCVLYFIFKPEKITSKSIYKDDE